MKTKAVIFDLFGTLVYLQTNTRPYFRVTKDFDAIRKSLVIETESIKDFCKQTHISITDDIQVIEADLQQDIKNAELFPDAIETLSTLKQQGLKLAVISNLASPYKQVCAELDLAQWIDLFVFSCNVEMVKPSKEIYAIALKLLDVLPEETIMVGDNLKADALGPKACGIQGIWLDRSDGHQPRTSISTISQLSEVSDFLKD